MQLSLIRYRLLMAITINLWGPCLPTMANTLNEALPIPQSQPSSQEVKPEISQEIPKVTRKSKPTQKPAIVKKKKEITPAKTTSRVEATEEASFGEEPNDPLEPLNRFIFGINDLLDLVILRPVSEIYRAITPDLLRNGVRNVLDNLFAPVSYLNHLLQGEAEQASMTFFRFLMNSSFGFFGLGDVASDMGFPRYDTDFNQTLTAWGVDTGPYLVLPLIGPSSFRGTVGFVADYYTDPLNLYLINRHHHRQRYWLTVRYGLDIISNREKVIETIDNLRNGSLDFYVTMRSIYFQRQAYMAEKLKSAKTPKTTKEEGKSSTS